MLRSVLFAAALAAAGSAHADAIARKGADWVRVSALPCKDQAVITAIKAHGADPLDFRAAQAEAHGRSFNACWHPDFQHRVIIVQYDDGDHVLIPFAAMKPVPTV